MTTEHLPPFPWSYTTNAPVGRHEGAGFVYLVDATGKKIGTVWGSPEQKMAIVTMVLDAAHELSQRPTEGRPPTIAEVIRDA